MKTLHGDTSIERDPVLIRAIVWHKIILLYMSERVHTCSMQVSCAQWIDYIPVWQEINIVGSNGIFFSRAVVQFERLLQTRGQSRSSRINVIALRRMHVCICQVMLHRNSASSTLLWMKRVAKFLNEKQRDTHLLNIIFFKKRKV